MSKGKASLAVVPPPLDRKTMKSHVYALEDLSIQLSVLVDKIDLSDNDLAEQTRRLGDRLRIEVDTLLQGLPTTQHTCVVCGERVFWARLSQAALIQTKQNVCVGCWMSPKKREEFIRIMKETTT